MGLEAAGDLAGMERIYKGTGLKTEMKHRGIVLVASEGLFLTPGLRGFALAFCSLIFLILSFKSIELSYLPSNKYYFSA